MKQLGKIIALVGILSLLPLSSFADGSMSYKDGFMFKNEEETFKLKTYGRLQQRFFYKKNDTGTKQLSFRIRRAELRFKASVHDKMSFVLGLRHATNSADFAGLNVTAVTGTYAFDPKFAVTAGMVGLPLDLMNETSSSAYLLPEPAITHTQNDSSTALTAARSSFGVPDGLGVNFSGDISKFFYSASVVNAAESNYTLNGNRRMSFGARVGMNILDAVGGSLTDFACSKKPQLTVSFGGMFQGKRSDTAFKSAFDDVNGVTTGVAPVIKNIMTGSGGVGYRYAGLSLQGEAYYRRTKFTSFGSLPAELRDASLIDSGYYGAAGYYIIPKKFEVAGQAGQIFREGADNDSVQFGGGVNWYIHDNNLKLQLAYTWAEIYNDIVGGKNNNQHEATLNLHAAF